MREKRASASPCVKVDKIMRLSIDSDSEITYIDGSFTFTILYYISVMRKQIGLFFCLLWSISSVYSQKNVIRLGIPSLFAGQANGYYERMISDRISVSTQVGYAWPSNLPFFVESRLNDSLSGASSDINLSDAQWNGGVVVAPEVRFYTGKSKEGPRGFYVAPRLSFAMYSALLSGTHTYGLNNTLTAQDNATLRFSNFGLNAQLGVQWLIKDRVVIDWSFLGIGLGRGALNGQYETDDTADLDDWLADVKNAIQENNLDQLVNAVASREGNVIKVAGASFVPIVRTGLSIGVAF